MMCRNGWMFALVLFLVSVPVRAQFDLGLPPGVDAGVEATGAYWSGNTDSDLQTLGWGGSGQVFYQFSPILGTGAKFRYGRGPELVPDGQMPSVTQLLFRVAPLMRGVIPYLLIGAERRAGDMEAEYGPVAGLGINWSLRGSLSLFQEVSVSNSSAGDDGGLLASGSFGLRTMLYRKRDRVDLTSIEGPDSTRVGIPVRFHAEGEMRGGRIMYTWSMGNGIVLSGRTVTETYMQPGSYQVSVTVEGRGATGKAMKVIRVLPTEQEEQKMLAEATLRRLGRPVRIENVYGRTRLEVGEEENFRVRFNAEAAWPIVHYWDFGDGTFAEGNNVVHRFEKPGRYEIIAHAKNSAGEDYDTLYVNVVEPPEPTELFAESEPEKEVASARTPVVSDTVKVQKKPEETAPVSQPANTSRRIVAIDWSKGGYTWVVRTFLKREEAENLAMSFARRGYRSGIIIDDSGPGSVAYRVIMGQYETADAAVRARPEIEKVAGGGMWLHELSGGQ